MVAGRREAEVGGGGMGGEMYFLQPFLPLINPYLSVVPYLLM